MRKILLAVLIFVLAAGVPSLIFITRSPALVVTDAPFTALYGTARLQRQRIFSSLSLFRPVNPVMIADGTSPDIVVAAVIEASQKPLCVIFPRHHAPSAIRYREQFPEIPVILLAGLNTAPDLPSPEDFLSVFYTDRKTDLYRAGLLAGIIGSKGLIKDDEAETQRKAVLWAERSIQAEERELFASGVLESAPEIAALVIGSVNEMPDTGSVSCLVLAGAGADYLEKNPKMPLILFSWLDPVFTSREFVVLFDDSPWALAVPAVQMAGKNLSAGVIPSKPLILSERIADNCIFRTLKKAAKKRPLDLAESPGIIDKHLTFGYNLLK